MAVRACAHAADAVVATDHALRPMVLAHLGVADARVVTIPNAIDLEWADALASVSDGALLRAGLGLAPPERLLVSAGRLEQNKGFHVLIGRWPASARRPRRGGGCSWATAPGVAGSPTPSRRPDWLRVS